MTTDRTREAAARVRAFLDYRSSMGGPIDHTTIHTLGTGDAELPLRTADLRELVDPLVDSPSTGGVGTLTPSVVNPTDSAVRELRAAVDKCVEQGARPADMFRAVLMGLRRYSLGGHREQLEGAVFEALAVAEPSPLEGMLLQPHQAYADRGNYAVLSVTRREDHTIDVDVVP